MATGLRANLPGGSERPKRKAKAGARSAKWITLTLLTIALLVFAGCGDSGVGGIGGGDSGGGGGGGNVGRLSGQITNAATGEAVTEMVTVSAGGQTATTGTGAYQLNNVPTGQQTLTAKANGYQDYSAQVNVPSNDLTYNIQMQPEGTTVTGQAVAPSGTTVATGPSTLWQQFALMVDGRAEAGTGDRPVGGAQVQAYSWSTGNPVGDPTTTDSNGNYTLSNIPTGADILVRIRKGALRLSSILAQVSHQNSVAMVNAASTIAAEVYGQHFGEGRVSKDVLAALEGEVLSALQEQDPGSIDLTPGHGWIGDEFGSLPSGAESHLPAGLQDRLKEIVGSPGVVAHARAIVADLRTIGPKLATDIDGMAMATSDSLRWGVAPYMQSIAERVSVIEALAEGIDPDNDVLESTVPDPYYPSEYFTMTVTLGDTDPEFGVTEGTFQVTHSAADFEVNYQGSLVFAYNDSDQLTQLTLSGGLADSDLQLTMPDGSMGDYDTGMQSLDSTQFDVALEVTITADRSGDTLNGLMVDGSFDSPVLRASGSLYIENATFAAPPELAKYADQNGNIVMPISTAFDGGLTLPDLGTFSGAFNMDFTFAEADQTPVPSSASFQGVFTSRTDVTDLFAGEQTLCDGSEHFCMGGHFGVSVLNAATFDYSAEQETPENFVQFSVDFGGWVQTSMRPEVNVDVTAERTAKDQLTVDAEYWHGDRGLEGTVVITLTGEKSATVDVGLSETTDTAEHPFNLDVSINVSGDTLTMSGDITDDQGATVATITGDSEFGLAIEYTDQTTETLI